LLLTLLLSSGLMCGVDALSTHVSFHSVGVTVDLTFPEEAHPTESITHNITITANTALTLQNFTLVIKAQVNSSWQEIKKIGPITSWPLGKNESLTPSSIPFMVPQNTSGRLYCFIYILTDLIADPSSYTFYTTSVRTLTYSELLSAHNELLGNYSDLLNEYNALRANYTDVLADYQTLLESYNKLSIQYGTLNSAYNELSVRYGTLNSAYNELSLKYGTSLSTYNSLLGNYNALRSDYNLLNSTHYSLQANYTSLEADYNSLNQSYTSLNQRRNTLENDVNDLHQRIDASEAGLTQTRILMTLFMGTSIALILLVAYLKRKKQEPYVVIRKETVAVKQDES
jgi:predicted nuclease with TOPRIM domain